MYVLDMDKSQYKKYLEGEHWKEFKNKYFKVHGWTCSKCGYKGIAVHLHHKDYTKLYIEEFSDIIPLCDKCHAKVHNKYYPNGKFNTKEE